MRSKTRRRPKSLKLTVAIKKRIGWRSRADAIRARGNYELELFGGKQAVRIEYHGIDGAPLGYARWRFVDPKQSLDGRKYTGRRGQSVQLYLCRNQPWSKIAKNPREEITITEGEEKADFASEFLGEPVIGTQGCDAFQAQGKPASLFDEIEWKGRAVTIVPDSDWLTNAGVRRGFARLGKFLAGRGADVQYRLLPTLPEDFAKNPTKPKTGIDDYLARCDPNDWEALPTLPLSDPKIAAWDSDNADGLPDALLDASPMPEAWLDPAEESPPITYAVDGLIALNETAAVAGGAGAGKTTFVLNLGIGIAAGRDVLNFTITKPRRVLYAMLERHENGFWRRVSKAVRCLFPDLTAKERQLLRENFRPAALAGQAVRLVEHRQNQWTIHKANVDALIDRMKALRIEVLVFDTLSRLHGGNSNDDSLATSLTTAFERITQATGAAVIVLAHTGKTPREDMYGVRGSSAWVDNTSNMIHLRLLDEKQREDVKIIGPKEARDDTLIVVMEHRRMSETTTMPTKHFAIKQGGDMDGWIWHVNIAQKRTPNEVINQKWFRDWHHTVKLTQNSFVEKCMECEGIGKRKAPKIFSELCEKGILEETGEKYRNGAVYKLAARYASTEAQPAAPRREKRRKKGR